VYLALGALVATAAQTAIGVLGGFAAWRPGARMTRLGIVSMHVGLTLCSACAGCGSPRILETSEPTELPAERRFDGSQGPELPLVDGREQTFRDVLLLGTRAFVAIGPDEEAAFEPDEELDPCADLSNLTRTGESPASAAELCRAAFPFVFEVAVVGDAPTSGAVRVEADGCESEPRGIVRIRVRGLVGETRATVAPFRAVEVDRCVTRSHPQPAWTFAARTDLGLRRLVADPRGADDPRTVFCVPDARPRRCVVLLAPSGWHTDFPESSVRYGLTVGDSIAGHRTLEGGGPDGTAVYVDGAGRLYLVHRRCDGATIDRIDADGVRRVRRGSLHGAAPSFECPREAGPA